MTETNVLPEDITAAEEITGALCHAWEHGEVAEIDVAAIIAASRPPLVGRLVRENARKTAALEAIRKRNYQYCHGEDCDYDDETGEGVCNCGIEEIEEACRAALSPAPALDLTAIERALLGTGIPSHDGHCWCAQPNFLNLNRQHEERCLVARAALASVREVTRL